MLVLSEFSCQASVKPLLTHGITDGNVLGIPYFSNSRLNCIFITVSGFICIYTYAYFCYRVFRLEPING